MLSTKFAREHRATLAILALAAVLRLVLLGLKPPHFDEGVNGWFLDQMTRTGFYHYDPANYHGPLHFYLLFIFHTLMGRTVWALRLPVVIVSIGAIWLVTRFDRFMPRPVCQFAALAMAVSPAMVFYGRYAIHETEFVFFLLLAVWGMAGLTRFGTTRYLWALGLGGAGMILTKETYIIHVACFGLAAVCLWAIEKVSPAEPGPLAKQHWRWKDAGLVAGVSLGAILFFYSGGLLDWPESPPADANGVIPPRGAIAGLWETFGFWFHTGQAGNGHEKPWFYWLKLLARYEWPAVLGLVWSLRYAFPGCNRLARFLAIYGCGALTAYSIVRYKTPWCVITLLWPFLFLFGDLMRELTSALPSLLKRLRAVEAVSLSTGIVTGSIAAILLAASLAITVRLNFFRYTDSKEPYVYVQTFAEIHRLTDPLFAMAKRDPANYHLHGNILLPSYHPLPWLLGDFTGIGYWSEEEAPEPMDADFLAVDEKRADEIEPLLRERYFTKIIRLRDSQDPVKLYFAGKKFRPAFPGREPDFPE